MNYKEVLENQIKRLEEVQEQVLKGIIEGNENSAYTEITLSTIANTSLKIQSLIVTLIGINQ
ncbi:GH3 auxin-responsive promoter family protein [Clostridium botulinum]|nr:GH3 auxin-responsive promoter family protein [Clostridium botulinum]NFO92501.1 GH3 auxin-responsive promoter family protein [Clostridium botulinum]